MKKGFCYEEETDRFVCRQGEYLAFQKLIYKKSTENYYRLYSRSKKQCKNCPNFSACATDLGTVRINASAYYPSFYRNSKKVGTSDYLRVMRLRKIWAEGIFAVLKRGHKLNKIQKRGLQKAIEECLLSATALNLKRLVKAVWITEFTSCFMNVKKNMQKQTMKKWVFSIGSASPRKCPHLRLLIYNCTALNIEMEEVWVSN